MPSLLIKDDRVNHSISTDGCVDVSRANISSFLVFLPPLLGLRGPFAMLTLVPITCIPIVVCGNSCENSIPPFLPDMSCLSIHMTCKLQALLLWGKTIGHGFLEPRSLCVDSCSHVGSSLIGPCPTAVLKNQTRPVAMWVTSTDTPNVGQ